MYCCNVSSDGEDLNVIAIGFHSQIPGNAIYFVSFELMKPYTGTLAAGGLSGTLFWFLVMPIDTVKTRFQVEWHRKMR